MAGLIAFGVIGYLVAGLMGFLFWDALNDSLKEKAAHEKNRHNAMLDISTLQEKIVGRDLAMGLLRKELESSKSLVLQLRIEIETLQEQRDGLLKAAEGWGVAGEALVEIQRKAREISDLTLLKNRNGSPFLTVQEADMVDAILERAKANNR